jgi:hypothetical protein
MRRCSFRIHAAFQNGTPRLAARARDLWIDDPNFELRDRTIGLIRGATVYWKPKEFPSWFVRQAVKLAHKERGWVGFFAYSDPAATERGLLYAHNSWWYVGQNLGREDKDGHEDWVFPDGTTTTSYSYRDLARRYGYTDALKKSGLSMAQFLRNIGAVEVPTIPKHKWITFEGGPRQRKWLRKQCRYRPLAHPWKGQGLVQEPVVQLAE